jgi:hypothetical protein
MPRTRGSAVSDPEEGLAAYPSLSRRPLQILVFLLPLVIAYEVGLAVVLRSSDTTFLTNRAHEAILRFFAIFGLPATGGLFLGGAAIVAVLLVWHVLTGESWRVDPVTPAIMAAESAVLTIPPIIFGVLIAGGAAATSISPTVVAELSLGSRLAISIGAGLYEELLFRMLLIAVVHTLLVDVGKLKTATGAMIAVALSAVAFAWYHPLSGFADAFFFFVAGLYFGTIYVVRGFGIVVGVHAFYDVIVVTLMNGGG